MSDTPQDMRAELERVTAERDALLAERERMTPLVAAARAYVETILFSCSSDADERAALVAVAKAARALLADGGAK